LNTITQSERGLKHISFLRRIFLKKLTGKLQLNFSTGDKGVLQFEKGAFLGNQKDFLPVLRRLLTEPIPEFTWNSSMPKQKTSGWVAPWVALSEALHELPIKSNQLIIYHHVFSNLPPMVLKNCPVHRMDFADADAYLLLYQLSLGAPSFEPKIFFLGSLNKDDLTKHVRTMLLVFLLGYLRPAPKKEESKNISVVSRILNRFKAKGSA